MPDTPSPDAPESSPLLDQINAMFESRSSDLTPSDPDFRTRGHLAAVESEPEVDAPETAPVTPDPALEDSDDDTSDSAASSAAPASDAGDGAGSTVPPPAASTPEVPDAPTSVELPPGFVMVGGNPVSEAQVVQGLGIMQYMAQLTPEQVHAIDAFISTGQFPAPQASTPQSAVPASADEEWIDPRAAAEIAQLRAELSSVRNTSTAAQQAIMAQQRAAQEQEVARARTEFASEWGFDPTDVAVLEQIAAQGQYLGAIARQNPNASLADNVKQAYLLAANMTPTYRDRLDNARVQSRVASEQAQITSISDKRKRAGVAAATSGSVGREAIPQALSPEQKREAAVNDISNMLNGRAS